MQRGGGKSELQNAIHPPDKHPGRPTGTVGITLFACSVITYWQIYKIFFISQNEGGGKFSNKFFFSGKIRQKTIRPSYSTVSESKAPARFRISPNPVTS